MGKYEQTSHKVLVARLSIRATRRRVKKNEKKRNKVANVYPKQKYITQTLKGLVSLTGVQRSPRTRLGIYYQAFYSQLS